MLGEALAKVAPVTIAVALVFSVLTHFWAYGVDDQTIPSELGGQLAYPFRH
jgi:hypothetical protein